MAKKVSKTKFDWVGYIKSVAISLLMNQGVKFLIGKLVSAALISSTWQIWLAKFIIEFGFDKIIIPLLNELELEGRYQVDVINGKKKVRLLNESRDNPDAVVDAFDNL